MSVQVPRIAGLSTADNRAVQNMARSIDAEIGKTQSMVATAQATSNQSVYNVAQQLAALQAQLNALTAIVNTLIGNEPPTYVSSVDIAQYQLVYEVSEGVAGIADNSAIATSQAVLGFAQTSAPGGSTFEVYAPGSTVTNAGWTLETGPVFLSTAGGITQDFPDVFQPLIVGYAVGTTSILVQIEPLPIPGALNTVPTGQPVYVPGGYDTMVYGALTDNGVVVCDGNLVEVN